jgi:signal transduction histidine kinase/ligand-binding sensor domain-containing protein
MGSGQISDIKFKNITLKDGLSQSSVYSIYQDYRGFIWFGTFDGLNRYDGRSITRFMPYSKNDSTYNLSNGNIWGMDGDKKGKLFIATMGGGLNVLNFVDRKIKSYKKGKNASIIGNKIYDVVSVDDTTVWLVAEKGVSRFDPVHETFYNYPFKTQKHAIVPGMRGHSLYIDKNKELWVGTYGSGLLKLDVKKGRYVVYRNTADVNGESNFIRDIESYKNGQMLVATVGGLYIFDPRDHSFRKHKLKADNLFEIALDRKGGYWITSRSDGVFRVDDKGNVKHFYHNYFDPGSLPDNMTVGALCDRTGNVWIGTYNEGVVMISGVKKPFLHVYHVPMRPGIPNNSVFSFAEDSNRRVWIGTQDGMSVWDRETNSFEEVRLKLYGKETARYNVWSLFFKGDELWVGTSKGIVRYNIVTKEQKHFFHSDSDPGSMPTGYVENILEDKNGNVWVATRYGLSRYIEGANKFKNYFAGSGPDSLSNSLVWRGYVDSSGRLWFATMDGLNLYNPEADNFTVYRFKEGDDGIMSNDISVIIEVKKDVFWLGTSKGISVFDLSKGRIIKNVGVKDGLASGYIYRFLRHGDKIWASTNNGLAVLDVNECEVKNVYFEYDGIQSNEFNTAAIKLSDGYFLFGGVNGITGFYPQKIETSDLVPPIFFTGLNVNGKDVSITDDHDKINTYFFRDIVEASQILLEPDERMFSLRFAALDYVNPEQVKYFYRLLPGSKEWISLGTRNTVTFVNLNPGTFRLEVRSTNGDGVLCENTKSLKVVINPPFWKKKGIVAVEILLVLLLFYAIFRYRTYKLRQAKLLLEHVVSERTGELASQKDKLEELASSLEKKVKERTAELEKAKLKAEESDMLKSAFLSNMSHEIRTPMNAIMGFSELLVTPGFDEQERRNFAHMVKTNGDTLLTLLNDIIDISMIESGQLKLNLRDVVLFKLVQDVFNTFSNSAQYQEKKDKVKLVMTVSGKNKDIVLRTDYHRLLQILNNLVSNAIKFTSEGFVEFGYLVDGSDVVFYVKDTGIGIGEPELKNIFKRFYKMQNGKTYFYPGNGLGLTITKNLVEAMNGKIRVESEPGKGTVFYFTFHV